MAKVQLILHVVYVCVCLPVRLSVCNVGVLWLMPQQIQLVCNVRVFTSDNCCFVFHGCRDLFTERETLAEGGCWIQKLFGCLSTMISHPSSFQALV